MVTLIIEEHGGVAAALVFNTIAEALTFREKVAALDPAGDYYWADMLHATSTPDEALAYITEGLADRRNEDAADDPRQKGDDDGVEYGDPRDEREERDR